MKAIWAEDLNGTIGVDGDIPWAIPEDLQHFKDTTLGQAVIMGRGTWESLSNPLPERTNVVVSTTMPTNNDSIVVIDSIEEAFERFPNAWVIGGGKLLDSALDFIDEAVVTEVEMIAVGEDLAVAPLLEGFQELSETPWMTSINGLRWRIHQLTRSI